MSVFTTADEKRYKMLSLVKEALELCRTCLDSETWGVDEYKSGFFDDVYDDLRRTKRTLEPKD